MEPNYGNLNYPSIFFSIISIVSPIIIPFVFHGYGGPVAIITAFIALVLSYRDLSDIGEINVYQWLFTGLFSYGFSMWNGFNGWVGDFQALICCLFFFGNALYIVFKKQIRLKVKIFAFLFIALVLWHFIDAVVLSINRYALFREIKRSFGIY